MENEKVSDCSHTIQDETGRSKDPNLCLPIPKPSDFISELFWLPTWRSNYREYNFWEAEKGFAHRKHTPACQVMLKIPLTGC